MKICYQLEALTALKMQRTFSLFFIIYNSCTFFGRIQLRAGS